MHKSGKLFLASIALIAALSPGGVSAQSAGVAPDLVDVYVKGTWKTPAEGWQARIDQDETQRICSLSRNQPSKADYAAILAREKASVVMPTDGNVLGKWEDGEKVAQIGTGGQFSDSATGPRGGNCYACHQMARKELSYGTLGPSLEDYGKIRKFAAAEATATYAKIYNAQSILPCSNMPRFGHNKFLSEQQIKDVTAYLFDPASPVNK